MSTEEMLSPMSQKRKRGFAGFSPLSERVKDIVARVEGRNASMSGNLSKENAMPAPPSMRNVDKEYCEKRPQRPASIAVSPSVFSKQSKKKDMLEEVERLQSLNVSLQNELAIMQEENRRLPKRG